MIALKLIKIHRVGLRTIRYLAISQTWHAHATVREGTTFSRVGKGRGDAMGLRSFLKQDLPAWKRTDTTLSCDFTSSLLLLSSNLLFNLIIPRFYHKSALAALTKAALPPHSTSHPVSWPPWAPLSKFRRPGPRRPQQRPRSRRSRVLMSCRP